VARRTSKPDLQRGTDVRAGRTAYYREGRNRSLTSGGYTASRYQGEYHLATPKGQQVAATPPSKTYHRFILAEFIACLAMVAASLVLTPGQAATEGDATATRSFAKELVQLTALCIVFFVLALASTGEKTGKVAAAFGGLVTLGVAWNLSGIFTGLAKALGPPSKKTGGTGG
jgi:hypothetical protein